MKKHYFVFLFLITVSMFGTTSHENEFIKVNVHRDTGIFNLGTIDDEPLLDGYPDDFDKAFFIVNYDGELLTNFPGVPETAPLLDTTMLWEDSYITTEWAYDDLFIWQKLRFLEDDSLKRFLNIELMVYNEGDSHTVGVEYMMDLKVGDNDNPGLAVPWQQIVNETIFTDPMPGYFAAYEDIAHHDSTMLFAMGVPFGREHVMPDILALANNSILDEITFDTHISGAEISDAALLLRWNDLIVFPTGMQVIEFNWGLPYPEFDEVKELEKVRSIPNAMELSISPNPFNGRVSVELMSHFPVPRDSRVEIYSLDGRVISTLHNGPVDPGINSFFWEPGNMSSGIYLVVQTSGKIKNTERAIYLK